MATVGEGAVYVQTNEPQNTVVAFRRGAGGMLDRLGSYTTGGAGDAEPHLPSQGSVTVTSDRRHLLVTNAASDDVSVFALGDDGVPELLGRTPAGAAPKSVAEHGGVVYALGTSPPTVTGLRLAGTGLQSINGQEHALAPDADPAQVGFSHHGSALVVTERGTDSITIFPVGEGGTLGDRQSVPSSGRTPYGFAGTAAGTLVVTEAFGAAKGAAAASSYMVDGMSLVPVSPSVGNGRSEICWAAVTADGAFAFTTNFADGAVSRYAIGAGGALALDDATAALTVDGRRGLRDLALSGDGRHLYALDADAGAVYGWAVGAGGALAPIGSWDGLPATVAGIAVT